MLLKDKVAIVTGSSSGIGRAIAISMAAEGASVIVDYVGHREGADQTVKTITDAGGKAAVALCDVSDAAQVQAMVDLTIKTYGRLDILVNNAGLEYKHPFTEFPIEHYNKIIAVDLTGPWLCAQVAAKQMISQGQGGRIINISSVHEDLPMVGNSAYCAAKGALRMLMRTIAVELASHKITVNNIGPGAIFTPIDADVQANPAMIKELMAEIPLGRWGKPEEVGGLAVFLASDAAAYMTGSTCFIDGGMLRQAGRL